MRFAYTARPQRVVFGAGELANLGAHLNERLPGGGAPLLGGRPALLCTSRTYVRNGTVERVRAVLGEQVVAVFDGVQPHVPASSLGAALELAVQAGALLVIGLGGGSAIGTAKATAVAVRQRLASHARRVATDGPDSVATASPEHRRVHVPVVAIPTTYAGSEMTPIYGITDEEKGEKVTVTDERALPALVVYDPELTLDLPADLTASTGINALAHCVEGAYATTRSPVSTATALAGVAAIHRALPRCVADGHDLGARTELLAGAYLAGTTIAHAGLAVHHGLCHVLGGSAGVPHGVANSIVLPHAMRFNLPDCAPELAAVARALGLAVAGLSDEAAGAAAIDAVDALVGSLGLPWRLRDAGVAADDLPRLAALALKSRAVQANPRPITQAAQVEAILRVAW